MKSKFLLALVGVSLLIAAPASSQPTNLVEAAKKEGSKVVVYGSLESDTTEAIAQAFQKKTGIEAEYWRGSATKVVDRALSEYRTGRPLFDVILTNSNPMQILEKDGIFAKYDSPFAREFPKAIHRIIAIVCCCHPDSRRFAAPLACIAGSLGTLIGADHLNLGSIQGLGVRIASIGGAGTFEGIFLTGIIAVLLALRRESLSQPYCQ